MRKMLTGVNDNMLGRINLSERFADIEAGDPVGTADLKANLRLRAFDRCLKEISLLLRNIGMKGASYSVVSDD